MASTKYDIASSALVLIGAEPVSSFGNTDSSTTEQKACYHLYQSCLDFWLSVHSWHFAEKTLELNREVAAPASPRWTAKYAKPSGMKKLIAVLDAAGNPIEYVIEGEYILTNTAEGNSIYALYTYEPSVGLWPGYFVQLMEYGLASKLTFALSGKIDLKKDLSNDVQYQFRLAKSEDAKQQTAQRIRLDGRGSIMEARRA